MINITICVDGQLTVREGDQIATCVEQEISTDIASVRGVHVHYHPRRFTGGYPPYPHQDAGDCK